MTAGRRAEAYLAFMRERLVEAHRLLRPHGSVYLHCDPSISHHLRFLLDDVFGERNFRNEIIWQVQASSAGLQ